MVDLNPKYSDINYMSRFFLLMCNRQTCPAFSRPRNFNRRLLKFCPSFSSPAFSRPRNIRLSFSSVSFSRPLVFFVRHFQVVHFQRPRKYKCELTELFLMVGDRTYTGGGLLSWKLAAYMTASNKQTWWWCWSPLRDFFGQLRRVWR